MQINKEQLREKFKGLSTRYGGSLLTETRLLNQSNVTVFFGLGGLGGRAVNAIKSASNEKLNHPDRRFYRVLDTDLMDMDSITEINTADNNDNWSRACMTKEEMIELYDRSYPLKISDLDSSVDSWFDRKNFDNLFINNHSAQAIRQIGRLMLLVNYNTVYSEVYRVINDAFIKAQERRTYVKIYIIAGVGGGTGGGAIVDFSYMVRKILQEFCNCDCIVEGIIFTPDVQENNYGVDFIMYKHMEANFYAAIKEIDYFYNNKARNKSYICPIGDESITYDEDIFDECTLVSRMASGSEIAKNSDEVIGKLAEALTYEMSGIRIKADDGSIRPYDSFYSSVPPILNMWLETPSGEEMNIPDWLPMRYSSLGYSSFYVPCDELLAYCANRLMERLIDQWNKLNITEDEIIKIMRKSSLDSNRSFAKKIFQLAKCGEIFDVEKSALPRDGFGPLPVRNCVSYLDTVREIAKSESRKNYIAKILGIAEKSRRGSFVDPIISEIDKAFSDYIKGPVYAINLLSSGIDQNTQLLYTNSGVLVRIRKMIAELNSEASNWKLELDQMYNALREKAERLDGRISADASDLAMFTDDSRQYAEDLLKVAILKESGDYLTSIYNDLIDKNNRVFEIYTTTFEFLLATLKKDAQYVTDSNRQREGHTTIFSFNVANFEADDPKSKRFKDFFDQVVDGKNLYEESRRFVEKIFGKLKEIFDPVTVSENTTQQATEDDIIEVVRDYFNDSFSEWTSDIIEKFCVIAYSTIDVTPELLTEAWNNPALKNAALQAAAQDIETTVSRNSAVMLTSADPARSIENYPNYTAFAALDSTRTLNSFFSNGYGLSQSNRSEFIGFKRVFGIPLSLVWGLEKYKNAYDNFKSPGMHLDEVGDDWRYILPEPFSYNVSKLLGKFQDNGHDITEIDRLHMLSIFKMAQEAKRIGVLKLRDDKTVPSYDLYYKFMRHVDFSTEKESMYEKFRSTILREIEDGLEGDFMSTLSKAGYALDEPVSIEWTFVRPEYNVMGDRGDFGNDIVFGNFITLIRSNYEWERKLVMAIESFGKIYDIYEKAKNSD